MTLTREQIEAMPAGREMDESVAEHAMGWSYQTFPEGPCPDVKHWYSEKTRTRETFRGPCPPYSTNVAAAWTVVEALHVARVELGLFNYNGTTWCCELQAGRKYTEAEAETVPLAICRAVLMWVS